MKFNAHHAALKPLFVAFCLSSSLTFAKPIALGQARAVPTTVRVEAERASGPFAEWMRALRLMFSRSAEMVKR